MTTHILSFCAIFDINALGLTLLFTCWVRKIALSSQSLFCFIHSQNVHFQAQSGSTIVKSKRMIVARPYDVPLFARTSTSVPRRSYQASHRSCIATSTTFCQPTPANRTPLSTQQVRTSGFSSCWSDGLELAAR